MRRNCVVSHDDASIVNKAIEVPDRLVDPGTGRQFVIQEWHPSVCFGELVRIKARMLVEQPKGEA